MSDAGKQTSKEAIEPSAKARRRRRLYLIWTGINLTLVLAAGGFYFMTRSRDHAEAEVEVSEEAPAPTPRTMDPVQAIAQGDLLLVSDQPIQALELYRQAQLANGSAEGSATAELAYRIALALELSGSLEEAMEFYQAIGSGVESGMSMLGKLGYSRTLLQAQRNQEAYEQLTRLAAIESHPFLLSPSISADVDFLLAFASGAIFRESAGGERGKSTRLSLHDAEPVPPNFKASHLLNLIGATSRDVIAEALAQPELGCHLLQPGKVAEEILLSVHFEHHQGTVILDALAAVTSWKVEASSAAKEILQGRRLRLLIKETSATHLLTLLLSPQQLIWDLQGDRLVVDVDDRIDRESRMTRHLVQSRRLFQRALFKWPRHDLVAATTLSLANLAYEQRQIDEAITTYQEVTTRFDPSPVLHIAWFNLGKAYYRKANMDAATEAFYHAVDERAGEQIESAAYLFLGRIHLERGDIRQAQIDLSRCHARATEEDTIAHSCMLLAASYLLSDKMGSAPTANELLMERRTIISSDAFRTAAAFLSAYSRFRVAVTEREVQWRARDFTAASFHVQPSDFFGDTGYLLIANALVELHLDDKLQEVCETAVVKPLAPYVHHDLSLKLGRLYASQPDVNEPKKPFKS